VINSDPVTNKYLNSEWFKGEDVLNKYEAFSLTVYELMRLMKLERLLALVDRTPNLKATLNTIGDTQFTIFAPVNEAFEEFERAGNGFKDDEEVKQFVYGHIVPTLVTVKGNGCVIGLSCLTGTRFINYDATGPEVSIGGSTPLFGQRSKIKGSNGRIIPMRHVLKPQLADKGERAALRAS